MPSRNPMLRESPPRPSFSLPSASRGPIPSVFPKTRNQENPPTAEGIRNNHRPHNRGVSIILFRAARNLRWQVRFDSRERTSFANDRKRYHWLNAKPVHPHLARKFSPPSSNLPRLPRRRVAMKVCWIRCRRLLFTCSLFNPMLQASRL